MRLYTVIGAAVLLAAAALAVPNTPISAKWSTVGPILEAELLLWAENPTTGATCGAVACCQSPPASQAQCLALSQEITQSTPARKSAVALLAPCISRSSNWKCDQEIAEDGVRLDCQTVPGFMTDGALTASPNWPASDAVRLADVATCASKLAFAKF